MLKTVGALTNWVHIADQWTLEEIKEMRGYLRILVKRLKQKTPDARLNRAMLQREWRQKNLERIKQRDHNYYIRNRERILQKYRERTIRDPKKRAAQQTVKYLKLPAKECSICGNMANLQKHHPDYNKPREIVVLCTTCHQRLHSKYSQT